MYAPEKKYFNRHMNLTMLNTSTPNTVLGPASKDYNNPLNSSFPGIVNRWVGFRWDATSSSTDFSNLYAFASNGTDASVTDAGSRGYNDSPFALTVPQGAAVGGRIGRDISVVKDSFYFRFTFPRLIPGNDAQVAVNPGTLDHQRWIPYASLGTLTAGNRDRKFGDGLPVLSYNLSQRPIRIRLVCVMQSRVDSPGLFGFRPKDLFESEYDIHSRFSGDAASGYKIVFDQTQTCTLMDNLGNGDDTLPAASLQDDKSSSGPYECRFKANIPPYLRRYEGKDTPENTDGKELAITSGVATGGITKGALTWYAFIEDVYCPVALASATGTIASQIRYCTPEIINMEVNRKTFWIDP